MNIQIPKIAVRSRLVPFDKDVQKVLYELAYEHIEGRGHRREEWEIYDIRSAAGAYSDGFYTVSLRPISVHTHNGGLQTDIAIDASWFRTTLQMEQIEKFREANPRFSNDSDAADAMVGHVAAVPIRILKRERWADMMTVDWLPDSPKSRAFEKSKLEIPETRPERPNILAGSLEDESGD